MYTDQYRTAVAKGSVWSDARLMSCADDVDVLNIDVGRVHWRDDGMEIDRNRDRMALNLIGAGRGSRRAGGERFGDERCIDADRNVMRAGWVENETGHFSFSSRGRKAGDFSIGRRTCCSALNSVRWFSFGYH